MRNTIMKKHIEMLLKPNKKSRTISFDIELRIEGKARDFISLENINRPIELSICAATRKGGVACQKYKEILSYRDRIREEDIMKFDFIMDIWKKYHLNCMHAGTKAQEDAIENVLLQDSTYIECCKYLEKINLLVDRDYKYGSDWLVEIIPHDILRNIEKL